MPVDFDASYARSRHELRELRPQQCCGSDDTACVDRDDDPFGPIEPWRTNPRRLRFEFKPLVFYVWWERVPAME